MKATVKALFTVWAVFLIGALLSVDALAATFIVNTNDDVVDSAGCDSEHCSLREAILTAEQNVGEDTILFDGDHVISPIELLPGNHPEVNNHRRLRAFRDVGRFSTI